MICIRASTLGFFATWLELKHVGFNFHQCFFSLIYKQYIKVLSGSVLNMKLCNLRRETSPTLNVEIPVLKQQNITPSMTLKAF